MGRNRLRLRFDSLTTDRTVERVSKPSTVLEESTMPNVMLRNNAAGQLVFYITKKDHEEIVVALEHPPRHVGRRNAVGRWFAVLSRTLPQPPKLPLTVRGEAVMTVANSLPRCVAHALPWRHRQTSPIPVQGQLLRVLLAKLGDR